MNLLLIDNFDSFTFNLAHLLAETLNLRPEVISYGDFTPARIRRSDVLVISPGPGRPDEYGRYKSLRDAEISVLGICLGMQIMNEIYGGRTAILEKCIHGKTDEIRFEGGSYKVARYHSLYCSPVAPQFEVISENRQGIPMAIRHRNKPIIGYQFHPESFLTPKGRIFIDYAVSYFGKHIGRGICANSSGGR